MKITCHCGSTIYDATDNIPNKARFTPDQGWCAKWDDLDEHVIGAASAGQLTPDAASMRAREIFGGGRFALDVAVRNLRKVVSGWAERKVAVLRTIDAGDRQDAASQDARRLTADCVEKLR